jgi:hypothetical protein
MSVFQQTAQDLAEQALSALSTLIVVQTPRWPTATMRDSARANINEFARKVQERTVHDMAPYLLTNGQQGVSPDGKPLFCRPRAAVGLLVCDVVDENGEVLGGTHDSLNIGCMDALHRVTQMLLLEQSSLKMRNETLRNSPAHLQDIYMRSLAHLLAHLEGSLRSEGVHTDNMSEAELDPSVKPATNEEINEMLRRVSGGPPSPDADCPFSKGDGLTR